MQLPEHLRIALEAEVEGSSPKELSKAREILTQSYRSAGLDKQFMKSDLARKSYLVSRLPATYAAAFSALKEVLERMRGVRFHSLLDLGAGPGTVMWAAAELLPELNQVTLLEQDQRLIEWGKELARHHSNEAVQKALWLGEDIESKTELPPHDLVVFSYSFGELSPKKMEALLDMAWAAANICLVVVEPGTPAGFERIRFIRDYLIRKGAHLAAPCPHQLNCPMKGQDWCHFSARVQRTALHRQIKGGSLGYEDEKFSYIAAAKIPVLVPASRVLRQPLKRSGHVDLTLCAPDEVKKTVVSKRTPEQYKYAKTLSWGDAYDISYLA